MSESGNFGCSVGEGHDRFCDGSSTLLIGIEIALVSPILEDVDHGVAEVDCVLYAEVHALAAGGAVNVGGVARQQKRTVAEAFCDAMVYLEPGSPHHGVNLHRRRAACD